MFTLYRRHSDIGRKKIHDFIRHYGDGQIKPFELKPMDMEQLRTNNEICNFRIQT